MILGSFAILIIFLIYVRYKCGDNKVNPPLSEHMTQSMLMLVIGHLSDSAKIMEASNYSILKNGVKFELKDDILFLNNVKRLYEIVYTTKFNVNEESSIDHLLEILLSYRNKLQNPFRRMVDFLDKLEELRNIPC